MKMSEVNSTDFSSSGQSDERKFRNHGAKDSKLVASAGGYPVVASLAHNASSPSATAAGTNAPVSNSTTTSLPTPLLGVTGVLCQSYTIDIPNRGTLHYTVYRPRLLPRTDNGTRTQQLPAAVRHLLPTKPPLICVAGGPLLPCEYLFPLVHLVADRAVVLYDAMGCGASRLDSLPTQDSFQPMDGKGLAEGTNSRVIQSLRTFVAEQVKDLNYLIQALKCPWVHLFGHSFGGIVVHEYVRDQNQQHNQEHQQQQHRCLSVVLASTPVSIPAAQEAAQSLLQTCRDDLETAHFHQPLDTAFLSMDPSQRMHWTSAAPSSFNQQCTASKLFAWRHECRVTNLPLQLHQAYIRAGLASTAQALAAVQDYVVLPKDQNSVEDNDNNIPLSCTQFTPALILRGEFDWITPDNCWPWRTHIFTHESSQCETLPGCSHYAMLEDESLFGKTVCDFLVHHDPTPDHNVGHQATVTRD